MADDPIPESSGRSRRMSEPRLSLNRNGVPTVDFVEAAATGGTDADQAWLIPLYCCGAIFVLALVAGGIAVSVLTIIYLVDDEGKVSLRTESREILLLENLRELN